MNYELNLDITPGGMPPILHMSQYDTDRTYSVKLLNAGAVVSLDPDATAKVKGHNGKNAFEINCTVIHISMGHTTTEVEFQLTAASTDQYGKIPVTIEIDNDGATISPLLLIFDIQKAGLTNEQAASSPEFQTAMEAAVANAMSDYTCAVHFTGSGGTWSADKTYTEITSAANTDRPIFGVYQGMRYHYAGNDGSVAIFQNIDTSEIQTVLREIYYSNNGAISASSRNL